MNIEKRGFWPQVNVYSVAEYTPCGRCRDASRDCAYLIRALKHFTPNSPNFQYRLNARSQLDSKNIRHVIEWFGRLGALIISTKDFDGQNAVLVPFPDSRCTCNKLRLPRTLTLAEAIASRSMGKTVIADILRWDIFRQASHRGGSRDCGILAKNLRLTGVPPRGTLVLLDDVVTTGAHILAGLIVLRKAGLECKHAISVARTTSSCQPRFSVERSVLRARFPRSESPQEVQ